MKKFLSMLAIAAMVTSFWACEETSPTPADPNAPSVTAPVGVTNVLIETEAEITFEVETPGGYASSTVVALGGTAVVSAEPTVGAESGVVVVTFTAGSESAVGSVTLTVTDENTKTGVNTAVLNVTEFESVDVNFNITANTTWENGKIYILRGRIVVENGFTLTIEPGVIIKGDAGTGSNATALIIARGGNIDAQGTANEPIIFTSISDEINPGEIESPNLGSDESGLWGGLIVLGNAKISVAGGLTEAQIEGIPTSDPNGLYGGTDDADNSGIIRYVSIRHGGTNIGSGNEINGLTLGGVGSGTVIDHVEIVANQDDGIEFFGGTVSVENAVVWNCFDDGLDTDQAWNGTVDNFLIVAPNTGSGFELDGPEGTYLNGNHTFTNGTVYAGANIADLIDFDANSNVNMSNIYFYGFSNAASVKEYAAMIAFAGSTSSVMDFEHTLAGATNADPAVVFLGVPAGELTAVAVNANTVGADHSVFGWTWASQSGALAEIGLD